MIKILGKIPVRIYVAFSGGVDSVVITDFLLKGKRDVTLLYFNHDTSFGDESQFFVSQFSKQKKLDFFVERLSKKCPSYLSKEEHWRNERYNFLNRFTDAPIVMCHHLDDQIENWIFTSLHGQSRLIPYSRQNIIRPFILNRKKQLIDYAVQNNLPWMEDPSNSHTDYMRNYIRHNMVDHALHVNPGLPKVLVKKIRAENEHLCT